MQVKGIVSGLAGAARLGQLVKAADRKANAAQTAGQEAATGPAAAFRQIVSQYDVTNISPRSLSEMLQKLHDARAVGDADFQELSLMRLDLDAEGVHPDKPINLLDFYADRLQRLQKEQADSSDTAGASSADQASLTSLQHRLEWLRKVSAVQSAPSVEGIDQTI